MLQCSECTTNFTNRPTIIYDNMAIWIWKQIWQKWHVLVLNNSWSYCKRLSIWIQRALCESKEIYATGSPCLSMSKHKVQTWKISVLWYWYKVQLCFVTWHQMDWSLFVMGKMKLHTFCLIFCCIKHDIFLQYQWYSYDL